MPWSGWGASAALQRDQTGGQRVILLPRLLGHGADGLELLAGDEVAVGEHPVHHRAERVLRLLAGSLGHAHGVGHQMREVVEDLVWSAWAVARVWPDMAGPPGGARLTPQAPRRKAP
jgi:hypothetical protein